MYSKANAAFLVLFFILVVDIHHYSAWRRRRRRRCPVVHCNVTSWSYWSSCSASTCGRQGSQTRSRYIITNASCGIDTCLPNLQESRLCYGSRIENCQLSSWSQWSACPAEKCDFSAIQTSTRHRISTEKCGGWCTWTFRKTKMCRRAPDNCKSSQGLYKWFPLTVNCTPFEP